MEIIKSPHDLRNYHLIKLPNELEILYIEDPKTEKSAASMVVNVGFYQDPEKYAGMAHFLEHMLFMGTEKYPNENYFMEYLNKYGGSSNAMTADEYTCYFFDIQNKYFMKSLDIFAQFFISPLMKEDAVDREMNAVEEEHVKNINDSNWRMNRIIRAISNPEYPYSQFGTGNLETLNQKDIREKLLEFHHKYYSSNIMKLVLLSPISFDKMESIIVKTFSDVPNKNFRKPKLGGSPFDKIENKDILCHNFIRMVPIQDDHELNVLWQLPSDFDHFLEKPIDYITHLLGHEGDGSLAHLLKKEGWINALMAGKYEEDRKHSLALVSFQLTQEGLKFVPSILKALYQYIRLILEKGIQDWIFDELKQIKAIKFEFMQKIAPIKYVMNLALSMLDYPNQYIISGPYAYNNYTKETEKLIRSYLELLTPGNSLVVLSSKTLEGIAHQTERWYGIKYTNDQCIPKVPGDYQEASVDFNNMRIPEKNIYIPKKLDILPEKYKTKYPEILDLKEKNLEVWYKKDNTFEKPNCLIGVAIYCDEIYSNVKNFVMTMILTKMINHILAPKHYYARMANSKYNITIGKEYLMLNFDTYYDKIELLLTEFTEVFFNAELTKQIYDHIMEEFVMDLDNYKYNPPYVLASEHFKEKVYPKYYTNVELREGVDSIKFEMIEEVRERFKKKCYVRMLVQGNIYPEHVEQLLPVLKNYLSDGKKIDLDYYNILKPIEKGSEEIYIRGPYNESENNSAIQIFFEVDAVKKGLTPNWDTIYCLLMLIDKMTRETFFTKLRSIEQSGYIVKSSMHTYGSTYQPLLGITFLIQSSRKMPTHLRERIKKFITETAEIISKMSDKKLDKWKQTLIQEIKEENKNLYEEFSKNLAEVMSTDHIFDVVDHFCKKVETITKDQISEFYEKYFTNRYTRKVRIVEIYSSKHLNGDTSESKVEIEKNEESEKIDSEIIS